MLEQQSPSKSLFTSTTVKKGMPSKYICNEDIVKFMKYVDNNSTAVHSNSACALTQRSTFHVLYFLSMVLLV